MKNKQTIPAMKPIFTIACCLLISLASTAQTKFQKSAGSVSNDRNYHLTSGGDGSLYATGYTEAVVGHLTDAFLVKYNRFGEVQWAKTYGDTGDETIWDLIITQNNQIVGVGYTSGLTANEAAVITRTDTAGTVIWSVGVGAMTGNVNFYRVIETSTGDLVATGLTSLNGNDDIVICKFNSSGTLLWSRIVKTPQDDEMMGLIETSQGHYLLAGLTNDVTGGGSSDFAVVKTDANGNVIWKKRYGSTGGDRLNAVLEINGAYYFMGWSSAGGIGSNDIVLMRTDTAGVLSWAYGYGNLQTDRAFNMLYNPTQNAILIAGYTDYSDSTTNNRNTLLMSVDLTGQINWARSYGSTGTDGHWPTGLAQNNDEGYYLLASTNTFGPGNYSLYLTKTDLNGNSACNQKNPAYTRQAITGWSGVSFGTDQTATLISMNIVITGVPWSITSASQCCALYNDAGPDADVCNGGTVQIGQSHLTGYSYQWSYGASPAGTGPVWQVPSTMAGSWILAASAPGSGCNPVNDTVIVSVLPGPPKPTVSYVSSPGNYLTSSSVSGNQWYYNGNLIPSATNQVLHAILSGVYYVEVADSNGCTNVSDTIHHIAIGINEVSSPEIVRCHPNPANHQITLTFPGQSHQVQVLIVDLHGRVSVLDEISKVVPGRQITIATDHLPQGIYRLLILSETGNHTLPLVLIR
jgi:hypothetical protein